MPILHAYSFLVHPAKNEEEQPTIGGAQIRPGNRVHKMLSKMYDEALTECDIEIQFRPTAGKQKNECRELMMAYANNPTLECGRLIADRLQRYTTRRSGLGLLFLAVGDDNARLLLVSRFPADEGVVAEELEHRRLQIKFIERIFMKNARTYKSAIYPGPAAEGAFWKGFAVDKQIGEYRELSNYWIGDFLDSELATTSAAGTKRVAVAFREAIKATASESVREQLVAASQLARNFSGRIVTIHTLSSNLALDEDATDALIGQLHRPELAQERFRLDREEFDKHIKYRSLTLDNGAVLTAETARFMDIFQVETLAANEATYSTTGSVVSDKLRKTL